MADTRRELKFAILSDTSRLDTDKPARGLEDLGDAAEAAGRSVDRLDDIVGRSQLDKVERDAKDGSQALDDFERQARQTANRVDDALDDIAKSARNNLRGLGDDAKHGMREAGEATQTFKDEARSNLSEVASSFQGDMTSAVDLVQGTLGGIVQDLGPLGLAIGAAGAAGLGIIATSIQQAKERVAELTNSFLDLRKQGIDPAADSASHLVDELDATQLSQLGKDAREVGVSMATLRAALDGNADAIEAVRQANKRYNDEHARGNPFTGEQADLHFRLTQRLNETEKAYKDGAAAAAVYGAAQVKQAADAQAAAEAVQTAVDVHTSALDSFTDPANVYTDLLASMTTAEQEKAQATADATKDQKDSWEDYAKSVDVSVDEYLAALEKQVKAQEQWAGNLQKLAKRGVDEGVLAELEKMGPQGAPLVAKLTTASNGELAKMVTLFGRQGAAAGASVASNLVNQSGAVSKSAQQLHAAAAVQLARQITVPVKLGDVTRAAREAYIEADRYFQQHPITLRTKAGARPIRDVP